MKKISGFTQAISKESFSWIFLKEICKIIGEFIETQELELHTDRLKEIIEKFDDCKKRFVKEMLSPKNELEKGDFCRKMLYQIRYILSKPGRLLNLRENPLVNKYIEKDYKKLVKTIMKVNKKFVEDWKAKSLKLINIDAHNNANAKIAMNMTYKTSITQWKKDLEYAHYKKDKTATIQCRICGNQVIASQVDKHSKL